MANTVLKSEDTLSSEKKPMIESTVKHSISANCVADFDLDTLEPCKNVAPRSPFAACFDNMASAMSGANVIFATDDWFAAAENLLQDGPPIFDPDAYCEQGKVLDGWETRRRRQAGHDWCLIQLSKRAKIHAIELDTAHFTGNNAPSISVDVCDLTAADLSKMVAKIPGAYERLLHGGVQGTGRLPEEVIEASVVVKNGGEWKELLPTTPLSPGFETTRMHYFPLSTPITGNTVRINYFPDGGVARFRCWGTDLGYVKPAITPLFMPIKSCKECTVVSHSSVNDESELPSRFSYEYSELSSLEEGGIGGACSNKHYGEPWRLIQTSLGKDMGDGWETARHPNRPGILITKRGSTLLDTPLSDWSILKLGKEATCGIARIILDTKHFRGNFPESVKVEGCYDPDEDGGDWFSLVPRSKMSPDAEHVFERSKSQIRNEDEAVTHVRVSIFPDGGISRVRIYG